MVTFGGGDLLDLLYDPVANQSARIRALEQPSTQAAPILGQNWSVVVGDQHIGPQYELTMATQRQIEFHVDDSSKFSFTLDGADPALPYIVELVTDVWIYRNGVLVWRGRIGASTDTLDGLADTYSVQFTAFDYREWLGRQILQPSRIWSWRNVTQAAIITDMFTNCINNQSGIHPTFTLDLSKLPTSLVNYDVTPGTNVKEAIGTMAGFGWQLFPNSTTGITFKAISPWYYSLNRTFVLEYGSTVDQVTRTLDTGSYANSSIYTGDMMLAPIQSDAAGIATMPQGRLAISNANPAIVDAVHLKAAAAADAIASQSVVPTYSCHLTNGVWESPADAWLGDIHRFYVWQNRIKVNDQYRITDIVVSIDDDSTDGDSVTITVAKPPYVPSS